MEESLELYKANVASLTDKLTTSVGEINKGAREGTPCVFPLGDYVNHLRPLTSKSDAFAAFGEQWVRKGSSKSINITSPEMFFEMMEKKPGRWLK